MEQGGKARARLATAAAVTALILGVFGAAPHASAAVTKNWAGPACPATGWSCTASTNGVTQVADGAGSVNHANCDGSQPCNVVQKATNGANNEAVCSESTSANGAQACTFDQTADSGSNTVTGNQSASQSTSSVSLANVTQDNAQNLTATQHNASGSNAITATQAISQDATSVLDASTPVNHSQESQQLVNAQQLTSGSGGNSATLTLNRNQTSHATGATPTETQDVRDNGASDPNGKVLITQHAGTGPNYLKIRGSDVKGQTATSLLGAATQTQGHDNAGWIAQPDVDSGTAGVSTIDIGTGGTSPTDGLSKDWTQHAQNAIGGAVTRTQNQIDRIQIPPISPLSPDTITSRERSNLTSDPAAFQRCLISAKGHADVNWTGQLNCNINDQDSTQTKTVNFSGKDINASLNCTQNAPDTCSGSTISGNGNDLSLVEGSAFNGQTATFTDSDTTESGFAASIDWGDGTSSTGTVSGGSGSFAVSGSHTYADEGSYFVKTTLTKSGTTVANANATATVSDAPLTATGKTLYASSTSFNGAVASFTDGNAAAPASDFTASISWGDGTAASSGTVASNGSGFDVSGSHTYASAGTYTITVSINDKGGSTATATSKFQSYQYVAGGSFSIGDRNSAVGTNVTWWGSQWSTANQLSGGSAPSSFKGFENSNTNPTCGTNWTSSGGNSPPPSNAVPQYMATIVTSKVAATGTTKFSGNTVQMVVVKTNPGYNPNTGSAGTGTVVAVIPC